MMNSLRFILSTVCVLTFAAALTSGNVKAAEAGNSNTAAEVWADSNEGDVFEFQVKDNRDLALHYIWGDPATVYEVNVIEGQVVKPGRLLSVFKFKQRDEKSRSKAHLRAAVSYRVSAVNISEGDKVKAEREEPLLILTPIAVSHDSITADSSGDSDLSLSVLLRNLWVNTGIYDIFKQTFNAWPLGIGRVLMILVGLGLLYLGIFHKFEPLLLVPIGFGAIMTNIPLAGLAGPDGILGLIYAAGVGNGVFPLLIFMGVGALTDFGPLIANPKTAILGAAAQAGIFTALLGALALTVFVPGIEFSLQDAASIGIIGGADGPTSIFVASQLSPSLLGAIAVAAYSYMALVPIIQPPIVRALTSSKERKVRMVQLREVSRLEKICFPLGITLLCALFLPDAAPLISMLMFGNLMRECTVVDRLSETTQGALLNGVTIMLGLAVGSKLGADKFLNVQTLGIIALGLVAFCIGTASGVIMGKIMYKFSGGKINPLIGASGVSAVPMAARVVNKMGLEEDHHNFLLMHAMGPNVAGVIGSAAAAGVLLNALRVFG